MYVCLLFICMWIVCIYVVCMYIMCMYDVRMDLVCIVYRHWEIESGLTRSNTSDTFYPSLALFNPKEGNPWESKSTWAPTAIPIQKRRLSTYYCTYCIIVIIVSFMYCTWGGLFVREVLQYAHPVTELRTYNTSRFEHVFPVPRRLSYCQLLREIDEKYYRISVLFTFLFKYLSL